MNVACRPVSSRSAVLLVLWLGSSNGVPLRAAHSLVQNNASKEGFAAIQKHNTPQAYRGDDDRYLSTKELAGINSIDCLQQQQRNPDKPCVIRKKKGGFAGPLSVGHFPSWRDPECDSHNEFFCDPVGLLSHKQQDAITDRLNQVRTRNTVDCGKLAEKLDPIGHKNGQEDLRDFNFAVVVADEWPSSELDPRSMQYFGRYIMSDWGLMPIYNGVDNYNGVNQVQDQQQCPNAAVLFVLPRYHEAFLLSPNCEFICASRGGPEVVAATLAGIERKGLHEGIMSGIDEASKILKVTVPLSVSVDGTNDRNGPGSRWYHDAWRKGKRHVPKVSNNEALIWTIRVAYVLVILIAVVSASAFAYFVFVPEKASRRSSVNGRALLGSDARRALLEEGYTA